jgi:hypothetical protein
MVVAAVSPQHAWQQPILRLVDTVIGVGVGVLAAWTGIQVKRLLPARSVLPDPAKAKIDLSERAMVRGPRTRLTFPGWHLRGGSAVTGVALALVRDLREHRDAWRTRKNWRIRDRYPR